MTPELKYLALITVFTTLMWIPYILNVITRNQLSDAVGYPSEPLVMAAWAERLIGAGVEPNLPLQSTFNSPLFR